MQCRSLLIPLALVAALLAAPGSAHADDVGGEDIVVPGPGGRSDSGTTIHGKLNLSLADAIKMGLENNLDVAVERYSPFIAYEDQRVAWRRPSRIVSRLRRLEAPALTSSYPMSRRRAMSSG